MTKIFFPYIDQPKKLSFQFSAPIRFPFYVNDLVYYWDVGSDGITMYLSNNQIDPTVPIVKDIVLEDTGITMYLVNEAVSPSKHIIVEFAKIGWGIDTLGLLDPLTIGEIDPFTLGEISVCYANWMNIAASTAKANANKVFNASNSKLQIESDSVLSYTKDIYTGELSEKIGIVGLSNMKHLSIGDLDPHTVGDIDAMLSTFRIFSSIPASLVKEIRIEQRNALCNDVVPALKDFSTAAKGINYILATNDNGAQVYVSRMVNGSNTQMDMFAGDTEVISDIELNVSRQYTTISNGRVSLKISVDNAEE